jgi:hypothetical protein
MSHCSSQCCFFLFGQNGGHVLGGGGSLGKGAEDSRAYEREEQQRGRPVYIPQGRVNLALLSTIS